MKHTARIILSFFGLVLAHSISAQGFSVDEFQVVVNEPSFTRYFTILDKEKTLFVGNKRDYQWYKSNKVMTTKGGQGGRLLHGHYKEHYLSKGLKSKGKYYRGLRQGKWKYWYESGMIEQQCRYMLGYKWGRQLEYDEKGNLLVIQRYRRGRKGGWTRYFENGEVTSKELFRKGVSKEVIEVSTLDQEEVESGEESETKLEEPAEAETTNTAKKPIWQRFKLTRNEQQNEAPN